MKNIHKITKKKSRIQSYKPKECVGREEFDALEKRVTILEKKMALLFK